MKSIEYENGIYLIGDQWRIVRDGSPELLCDKGQLDRCLDTVSPQSYGGRVLPQPQLNIFQIPDDDDYDRVEELHPWVRKMHVGRDPLGEFRASYSFVSLCRQRKTMNQHRTTYGLKHEVEEVIGEYVGEGSYIRAALLAGYILRPIPFDTSFRMNIAADDRHHKMLASLRKARREGWFLCPKAIEAV